MDNNLRIRRLIEISTSILIALSGLALAISCIHIYASGGARPFSRETVGKYLVYILPLLLLTVVSVITGIVFHLKAPAEAKKLRGATNEFTTLKRMRNVLTKKGYDTNRNESIKKEIIKRRIIGISYAAICLALAAVGFIIALDSKRYTIDNLNHDIALTAVIVLSLGTVALALGYICDVLLRKSASAECEIIKTEISSNQENRGKDGVNQLNSSNIFKQMFAFLRKPIVISAIKGVILTIAIVFIILGISNGGMADVLGKAVKICTECIGLG